ncbi:hypothetical protein EG68_05777 [Paragonimus skrjabini miyazakii]|uniref:Thioredoxin n=1 Tax=Paragonimus skrjabini miyazakii TaxID=59628 RepID=A0A8S9YW32_9TREM|nr:hypothetical protein EG68_05777 [Paragonimus skrjabini miyazakii]
MVQKLDTKPKVDEFIEQNKDKLIVIDFYADWCPPCRNIAPTFVSLSTEFPNAAFLKVNVDENSETAQAFNVRCMPTFVFLKNGKKVEEFSGADEKKLRQTIMKHI